MRIKREEIEELKKKIVSLENELKYVKSRDYISNYEVDTKISEQLQRAHGGLFDRIDRYCDYTEEKNR